MRVGGQRLSQAGRTTLIKAVAAAVPTYHFNCFLLPQNWCQQIDKAMKDFWWGYDPEKRRNISLISLQSLCTPKCEGGLGLRMMHEVNMAMMGKLVWKMLTQPECLGFGCLKLNT